MYSMNILIFGDSIARGLWDENGGWPHHLKKQVHGKTVEGEEYREVYNLGVSGETSFDLINRFEDELQRRASEDPVITVFQVGMNDSQVELGSGEHVASKEVFRGNIRELVSKASRYSKQTYFLGLTPVDEREVDPMPWKETHAYRNEDVKKYDNVMSSVVKRSSARYIPLFNQLNNDKWNEMLWDGVHPNTDGHRKIYKIIKDELRFI